jgi:hypothetical protein
MSDPPGENFFASWSNIEWALSAIWGCGFVVAAFVWRLAVRVKVLEVIVEQMAKDREKLQEDLHGLREAMGKLQTAVRHDMQNIIMPVQGAISDLGRRIDRVIDRRGHDE